jgi:hypothetical protein
VRAVRNIERGAVRRPQEALRYAREAGDRYCEAISQVGLAASHHRLGAADEALRWALAAARRSRECGYRLVEGQAVTALAAVHAGRSGPDDEEAVRLARAALAIHVQTGHLVGQAHALLILAAVSGHPDGPRREAGDILDRMSAADPSWPLPSRA